MRRYVLRSVIMKQSGSIVVRFLKDDLLRHTGILFCGMMVVNVCNVVFQMAVGRVLPDAEYTLLMAFLAVLAIIQRPLSTLRTGVAHYSSLLQQDGRAGDVKRLVRKWLLLTGGAGLFFGVLTVVFNNSLSGFLHLDRAAPVLIAGIVLPVLFCVPVLNGAAQGLQLFGLSSASIIVGALFRLGLGAGFVWFLYPACGWAMLGHGIGMYVAAGVLFFGMVWVLRGREKSALQLPSMRFYMAQSFFILAGCVILQTADIILVKHYVPDDTEFAFAATLGRMVVILPGSIVVAMFPKVASRGRVSQKQRSVFLQSFGLTALFVAVAVSGCWLVPGLLLHILFGKTDPSDYLRQMVGMMSIVMGLSALLNVLVQFLLAQRRFVGLVGVVVMSVLYLAGAHFSTSTGEIVLWAGITNLAALIWVAAAVFRYLGRGSGQGHE